MAHDRYLLLRQHFHNVGPSGCVDRVCAMLHGQKRSVQYVFFGGMIRHRNGCGIEMVWRTATDCLSMNRIAHHQINSGICRSGGFFF